MSFANDDARADCARTDEDGQAMKRYEREDLPPLLGKAVLLEAAVRLVGDRVFGQAVVDKASYRFVEVTVWLALPKCVRNPLLRHLPR